MSFEDPDDNVTIIVNTPYNVLLKLNVLLSLTK